MTNKKLKLAAMSVALTACVAAQPMAAHAVEGPDSVEDNAAPQAEPPQLCGAAGCLQVRPAHPADGVFI